VQGFTPDGKSVVLTSDRKWKGYRGGRVSTISLFDTQTHAVDKVFQPQGHANDADPNYSPSQSTMKHGGNS
jgi:hypothetical protein